MYSEARVKPCVVIWRLNVFDLNCSALLIQMWSDQMWIQDEQLQSKTCWIIILIFYGQSLLDIIVSNQAVSMWYNEVAKFRSSSDFVWTCERLAPWKTTEAQHGLVLHYYSQHKKQPKLHSWIHHERLSCRTWRIIVDSCLAPWGGSIRCRSSPQTTNGLIVLRDAAEDCNCFRWHEIKQWFNFTVTLTQKDWTSEELQLLLWVDFLSIHRGRM